VIAIIAILIGLLLPAVQKVRAAAARTQCANNLKQMGLGMHNYNDTFGKLPAGWVVTASTQPSPGWSWQTLLLPYIEQETLYNALNPDIVTPGAPPAATAGTPIMTPLKVYRCPADGGNPTNGNFGGYLTTNYVCNREVLGPDVNNKPTSMSVATIPDGSSNTILVGERDYINNVGGSGLIRHSTSSCSFEGRPGHGINIKNPNNPPTSGTGTCERMGFNSLHSGGVLFLFGDGSVAFLNNSISADQSADGCAFPAASGNFPLQNLIHPNDGYPVVY